MGFVVVDRSKWESNLLTVDWSNPQVILNCFQTCMNLGERDRGDVVKKCSIPVAEAGKSSASGLADRFWLAKTSEYSKMDKNAEIIEDFSNKIEGSLRIPKCPTATSQKGKDQKCKTSNFALSGRLSHPDIHYAEKAVLLMKRAMSKHMPEGEEKDSLELIGEGIESKMLQVAALTCLWRGRCLTAPEERRTQELHMDR